jgi:hypothetical protein
MSAIREKGCDIRARLGHPIIDGDGHVQEADFVLPDFLKKAGGADLVKRWESMKGGDPINRNVRFTLWNQPSGKWSIDRAMAMLPKLRRERHQEIGIDFAIVYTTRALGIIGHSDEDIRRGGCRAFNMMNADLFSEVKESMTPAAVIPMNTPAEAIEELDYAVRTLGFRRCRWPANTACARPRWRARRRSSPSTPVCTAPSASTASTTTTRSGAAAWS